MWPGSRWVKHSEPTKWIVCVAMSLSLPPFTLFTNTLFYAVSLSDWFILTRSAMQSQTLLILLVFTLYHYLHSSAYDHWIYNKLRMKDSKGKG